MTSLDRVRMDWVVRELRNTVGPEFMGSDTIFHYSIPVIDETGDGRIEPTEDLGSSKTVLVGGEVLISKLNPRKARVLIAERHDVPTVCSGEFVVLQPRDVERRYLYWLLLSEATRQELHSRVQSVTRSQQRARPDDISKMWIEIPSRDAQRAIADYLDAETARIDAIVALRRRQIELLDARFDVVREVWLQDLRREHGSLPLKRMAHGIEQGWSPECEATPADPDEWGVLKTSSVTSGSFDATENKRLSAVVDPDPRWTVNDGDLLVVRGSGSSGAVAQAAVAVVNGRKLLLPDLLYRVRLVDADPWFVAHALRSRFARGQFEAAIRTDVGMTRKIRTEDLASVQLPAVPPSRQRAAAAALTGKAEPIASARAAADRQVALILERRQALITVAVSGQLGIPGVAP